MAPNPSSDEAAAALKPTRAADAQPDVFPCAFDEWAGQLPAAYGVLLGGFRHSLQMTEGLIRKADGALRTELPVEWQRAFDDFCAAPPKLGPHQQPRGRT